MAKTVTKNITSTTGETVPALVLSPGKAPVVSGNFDDIENYLVTVSKRFDNVDIAKANIEEVSKIKKQFQTYRVSIEKIEKEMNDNYFNNPKKVMKGHFARLYARIGSIEEKCDDALAKDDEKRITVLNLAIDAYIKEFIAEHPLNEEYIQLIKRHKHYYNKTQDEVDTRNDLLAQIVTLHKEQKAYEANVRLIQKACAKDKRLSEKIFMDLLRRGDDIGSILEAIEEEVIRLNEPVEHEGTETTVAQADGEGEADGEAEAYEGEASSYTAAAAGLDFNSDLPGRTKTVTVKITYPADCGDALTKLFELLWQRGVKSEVVN